VEIHLRKLFKCTLLNFIGGLMNINLHLTGELEVYIESLIRRGFAANKTEAARMIIARRYQEQIGEIAPIGHLSDKREQHVVAHLQKSYASGKLKAISDADFRKKHARLLK
jgi:hypothetical protein